MDKSSQIKLQACDYSDEVLYGARRRALEVNELAKLQSKSDSVVYSIGTFSRKEEFSHRKFIENDSRIKVLFENLKIDHALPVQRYSWPFMDRGTFPAFCVSGQTTGKTWTHLIYCVCKTIKATPISITDDLIKATTESTIVEQPLPSGSTDIVEADWSGTSSKSPEPKKDMGDIDQTNFDFNKLGLETETDKEESKVQPTVKKETKDPDMVSYPRYVIVCSSQRHAELIDYEIDSMKVAAFGSNIPVTLRRRDLPPKVRTVSSTQAEDKLGVRCGESDILVTTPETLLKCIELGLINFAFSDKIIFDDIDLTLQLHNHEVREIIKIFLSQVEGESEDEDSSETAQKSCQIVGFARKWTILLRQFVSGVFIQKDLIFGSLLEASLYANMRYDIEAYTNGQSKITKLIDILKYTRHQITGKSNRIKVAIICKDSTLSLKLAQKLEECKINVKYVPEDSALNVLKQVDQMKSPDIMTTYIIPEQSLDIVYEYLTDTHHLVHFSLPQGILAFDRRCRLMYKHINDARDTMTATIFLPSDIDNEELVLNLYDIVSRSTSTLNSTKLILRDMSSEYLKRICWRWATIGVCKLKGLRKEDGFGSFCMERHSLTMKPIERQLQKAKPKSRGRKKPKGGEKQLQEQPAIETPQGHIKITVTHVVSPSEFYFWLEEHRDFNSVGEEWVKYPSSGREFMKVLQKELDFLKDAPSSSVSLDNVKKDKIFAVYFHNEARVDRVVLLEDPSYKNSLDPKYECKSGGKVMSLDKLLAYSTQCLAFKIDYGVQVNIYIRNLITLPQTLESIPAQCHRGFLLGLKPTSGEPFWSHKATKIFNDLVMNKISNEATAWLRLKHEDCFWLESMTVKSSSTVKDDIAKQLKTSGHAIETPDPPFLGPSQRNKTLSKWHVEKTSKFVAPAFLRRDKPFLDIFILCIQDDLRLIVRQSDFNKQIIELEDQMMEDYFEERLTPLQYFAPGVYCLAKVVENSDPEPIHSINRCKIIRINSTITWECHVVCLDHGDVHDVKKNDLFLAPHNYFARLPIQAIETQISGLDPTLLQDDKSEERQQAIDLIYELTRNETNDMRILKAAFDSYSKLIIYVPKPDQPGHYNSMVKEIETKLNIRFCTGDDPQLRGDIYQEVDDRDDDSSENPIDTSNPFRDPSIRETIFQALVRRVLRRLVIRGQLE